MSGFLLDTNMPSELVRSVPNPALKAWVEAQDLNKLFLSTISVGELRKGVTVTRNEKRRAHLAEWMEQRLLPFLTGGYCLSLNQSRADGAYWRGIGRSLDGR